MLPACRCAEYVKLVLEVWGGLPEVHRQAETVEDFVRAGVKDAVPEVTALAGS